MLAPAQRLAYNRKIIKERNLKKGDVVIVLFKDSDINPDTLYGPEAIGLLADIMKQMKGQICRIKNIFSLADHNPITLEAVKGQTYSEGQEALLRNRIWPLFCLYKCSTTIE